MGLIPIDHGWWLPPLGRLPARVKQAVPSGTSPLSPSSARAQGVVVSCICSYRLWTNRGITKQKNMNIQRQLVLIILKYCIWGRWVWGFFLSKYQTYLKINSIFFKQSHRYGTESHKQLLEECLTTPWRVPFPTSPSSATSPADHENIPSGDVGSTPWGAGNRGLSAGGRWRPVMIPTHVHIFGFLFSPFLLLGDTRKRVLI